MSGKDWKEDWKEDWRELERAGMKSLVVFLKTIRTIIVESFRHPNTATQIDRAAGEQGAHEVGWDGCPSCFGCSACDYDCCNDCTYDMEQTSSRCPTCGELKREGVISVRYWNQICNCESHNCPI